ncbi:Hsp20/alpha crystallin family protein [Falsiroseomonas ponticola]|uniref:Hsp20/alpha crystallin family protein n=1 Tax=Falsiroseomonas ponticola TaxID=2786951 RepID=UPI0019331565|nr:Hsp20/alpha crystallin family protein [Roseomonas ponticola]
MSGARGPRRPISVARAMSEQARGDRPAIDPVASITGMMEGLKGLAEGLGKLAEQAKGAEGEPKVSFGYSIRTLDGAISGGSARREAAPETVAPAAREPLVDVFEEAEAILVVAELPGVAPEGIAVELRGEALAITGSGRQRYHRLVPLPCAVRAEGMSHALRNGILEVRIPRAGTGG